MPRKDRASDQLRAVTLQPDFTEHAEGSVLVSFGRTRVLCTASAEERVPSHVKGSGRGWITAEYGMLPRATHTRSDREATKGKQTGRTQEIQRLIGRSLRAAVDLVAMGEGKLDAMTAVMTGKLQLSDMGLAMGLQSKMQALFSKMA